MTDPNFAEQVHALFERALSVPANEREQLLAESGADADVLAEVRGLLPWAEAGDPAPLAESRLGDLAVELTTVRGEPSAGESLLGTQLGAYRLLQVLGSGGMGTVYLAEQTSGVKRRVALKLIKLGMDSEAIVRRFERERRALALMNHDAIAKVFDVGTTPRGQPYFVMEWVEGRTLTMHCDGERLTLRERIELFQQVCHGVEHAHRRGVLHRDLKPANILVTTSEVAAVAKIIDFGVARAIDDSADLEVSVQTLAGMVVGTPAYMSPEQAAGDGAAVDTRADVYSLGVVLYELLTGELPYADPGESARDLRQALRELHEQDPPRPSTRLTAQQETSTERARVRRATAVRLRRVLRGDLDWIVMKALAREPDRRYGSPGNLAMDLQRYLDGVPVLASPPSRGYLAAKFLRRHRAAVATVALVFLTAVIGAVVSIDQALAASRNAATARANAKRASERSEEAAAAARESTALAGRLAQKVDEFNQVSAAVRIGRVARAAAELGPGWPENASAIDHWLDVELADLRAVREQVAATVERLRTLAVEVDPEGRLERMRAHADYDRVQVMQVEVERWQYLADLAAGRRQLERVTLDEAQLAMSGTDLGKASFFRTVLGGRGRTLGEEPLALAMAEESVRRADGKPDAALRWRALALAQCANGLVSEALVSADRAVELATPQMRAGVAAGLRAVRRIAAAPDLYWRQARVSARRALLAVDEPQRWSFPPGLETEEYLHDALLEFLRRYDDLDVFDQLHVIRKQLWAKHVHEITHANPSAALSWQQVRASVADDPRFAGGVPALSEKDVLGLVPLGPDPATGLQEFLHARSQWNTMEDPRNVLRLPSRRADGSLPTDQLTGIVFVLVPGGDVRVGIQGVDPSRPEYSSSFPGHDSVRDITLDPFFVAKFELTQQQWASLWGGAAEGHLPSFHRGGTRWGTEVISWRNPVEGVSWNLARDVLADHGLQLPTDVQWRHAYGGGSSQIWPSRMQDLPSHANLRDRSFQVADPFALAEDWEDGFAYHAPVGSFLPNAYGLYDLLGNVAEWLRDDDLGLPRERPGDGYDQPQIDSEMRLVIGGGFDQGASAARTDRARRVDKATSEAAVGVRPIRPVQPIR